MMPLICIYQNDIHKGTKITDDCTAKFENAYYNILSQSDFAYDYSISHVWSYWIPKNFDDIYSYAISSEKLQKNYVT